MNILTKLKSTVIWRQVNIIALLTTALLVIISPLVLAGGSDSSDDNNNNFCSNGATTTVNSADELQSKLTNVAPGTTILVEPGHYTPSDGNGYVMTVDCVTVKGLGDVVLSVTSSPTVLVISGEAGVGNAKNARLINLTFDDSGHQGVDIKVTDNVIIEDSTFRNLAGINGGAINDFTLTGKLTISNNTFTNNLGFFGGGAINVVATSELTIEDNKFIDNRAQIFGGAVRINSVITSTIKNNTFKRNSTAPNPLGTNASVGGGAFSASKSNGVIRNNHFIENSVTVGDDFLGFGKIGGGGAMNIADRSVYDVIDNTFDANSSNNAGGAINVGVQFSGAGTVISRGNTYKNNTGEFGGAVSVERNESCFRLPPAECALPSLFSSTEDKYTNNRAQFGGAIYVYNVAEAPSIEKAKIKSNCAEQGGGLYNAGEINLIEDSKFEKNFAFDGGAIFNAGTGVISLLNDSKVNKNSDPAIVNLNVLNIMDTKIKGNNLGACDIPDDDSSDSSESSDSDSSSGS